MLTGCRVDWHDNGWHWVTLNGRIARYLCGSWASCCHSACSRVINKLWCVCVCSVLISTTMTYVVVVWMRLITVSKRTMKVRRLHQHSYSAVALSSLGHSHTMRNNNIVIFSFIHKVPVCQWKARNQTLVQWSIQQDLQTGGGIKRCRHEDPGAEGTEG